MQAPPECQRTTSYQLDYGPFKSKRVHGTSKQDIKIELEVRNRCRTSVITLGFLNKLDFYNAIVSFGVKAEPIIAITLLREWEENSHEAAHFLHSNVDRRIGKQVFLSFFFAAAISKQSKRCDIHF